MISALLVSLVVLAPPSPACPRIGALPEILEQAQVVFVGRVESTTGQGHTARVRVEQVWKGAPISDRVSVLGEDRTYEPGRRYLFMPERDGNRFRDALCTGTQGYSGDVAQFAPDTVTLPRRSSTGSSGLAKQAAIALAVVLTGVVVTVVVSRLRRRRAPVTPS